jgi:hypothetical protein
MNHKDLEKEVLELEFKLQNLEERLSRVLENLADNDQSRMKAFETRIERLEKMIL